MTKAPKSYKDLNAELDELLARLQHPEIQVDEAVELYSQGLKLVAKMETHLETAQLKLNTLKLKAKA